MDQNDKSLMNTAASYNINSDDVTITIEGKKSS